MKTITTTINVYKFDELSKEAQDNAVESLYDLNVDYDWWDFTLADAKDIGLNIDSFDKNRCTGNFTETPDITACLIMKNHGKGCKTYKDAKKFLAERKKIIQTAKKNKDGSLSNDTSQALEDLGEDFQTTLLEDYASFLEKEYEYQTTREAIIETIEANDYDFTIEGKLY